MSEVRRANRYSSIVNMTIISSITCCQNEFLINSAALTGFVDFGSVIRHNRSAGVIMWSKVCFDGTNSPF